MLLLHLPFAEWAKLEIPLKWRHENFRGHIQYVKIKWEFLCSWINKNIYKNVMMKVFRGNNEYDIFITVKEREMNIYE